MQIHHQRERDLLAQRELRSLQRFHPTREDLDPNHDGRVDTSEIDHAFLRVVQDLYLGGHTQEMNGLLQAVDLQIPWLFSQNLRTRVEHYLNTLQRSPDSPVFVESLYRFVVSSPANGGLGVHVDGNVSLQENADGIVRRGVTNCLGFVTLFYGVCLLAGLDVVFFDHRISSHQYHSFMGVRLGQRVLYVDPLQGGVHDHADLRATSEVSLVEFFGEYHVNRALLNFNPSTNQPILVEQAWVALNCALHFSPHDASVYYTVGEWLLYHPGRESHRVPRARSYIERARTLDPAFPIPQDILRELNLQSY